MNKRPGGREKGKEGRIPTRGCIIFVSTKKTTADAVWKARLFGGGEKEDQGSADIDDHPDVQFTIHFFFFPGCSVSKCPCS